MSHVTSTGVVFSPLAARFFPGRGVLPFEEITAVRRTGKRVLLTLIDGGKRSLRTRSTSEAEALDAAVAQALHVAGAELDAVVSVASLGKALALRQETQSLPAPIWELLLLAAAKLEAQDLHLRTSAEGAVSLSLRRNGLLHELGAFEAGPGRALLNRLKVMAGLQAFRRDVAQEGRVELQRDDRKLSARVTTVPGLRGEQASIRLHNAAKRRALDELGFAPETHKALSRLTSLRRGLVLISGPPASGKSTTMFALLQAIQTADPGRLRCVSLEDPVEIDLPGVAQVQVDEARGNGFASLLKVVLRQDVDVILVGEIRDPETARLAVSAGTTGHLVLATIHAGSVRQAHRRLRSLHNDNATYATARAHDPTTPDQEMPVQATVWQELLSLSCPTCNGRGCVACDHTGVSGLRAAGEIVMPPEVVAKRHVVTNLRDAS